MSLLAEIQKRYKAFTEKEKTIADFILNESRQMKNINITDLAEKLYISTATVTRFCKKIGCKNFVDMKIKLEIARTKENSIKGNDIFSDVYNYYEKVIKRTQELINEDNIYKLAEQIKSANNIYIYGIGSSGLSAIEMRQRLLRMGFNVYSISDSHMMIINSAIISEDDLVIGISVSGDTKEVVYALEICKKHGAKTVAITSFEDSLITKYSDMTLLVCNTNFFNQTRFLNSQFSTIYILDLICNLLLKDELLNQKFELTIDAIINNYKQNGKLHYIV